MPKYGERYRRVAQKVDPKRLYLPEEALQLAKETASAKFDETMDIAVKLGVDPRKGDQMVRGVVNLPHGTGKTQRVLVFAKGVQAQAAQAAGAELVGAEELVEQIQKGWRGWKNFDLIVAAQEVMPVISRIGSILKARMPNPKSGTAVPEPAKVVEEIKKATRVEYRVDKGGIVHMPIGKVSYPLELLLENFAVALNALLKARPSTAKGRYLQAISVSTTMGPGIKVDPLAAQRLAEQKG